MAKEGLIRWKQGDYIKLGKAVADFNKKVKRLEAQQGNLGLPDLIDYKEMKSEIVTRKELNRQLQSLREFKEEGAEAIISETEVPMTKWEYNQLTSSTQIAISSAKKELETLNAPVEGGKYSMAQMGSPRVSQLEASIRNMENFAKANKQQLKDIKFKLKYFGTSDSSMKHAIIFRENYLNEMKEKYSDFKRYDKLMEYLYSISNPLDFYETLNNTSELISDLYYQSNQTYTEEKFSAFVSEVLGTKARGKMKERREELKDEYYSEKNKQDVGKAHSDISSLKNVKPDTSEFRGFKKL